MCDCLYEFVSVLFWDFEFFTFHKWWQRFPQVFMCRLTLKVFFFFFFLLVFFYYRETENYFRQFINLFLLGFFIFLNYKIMYLFGPHRVFVAAWAFLSLVAAASGVTLPVVPRVPIALALLAALGPRSTGASRCSTRAQRVRRTGFSCSEARASFPHLGSNPCPL